MRLELPKAAAALGAAFVDRSASLVHHLDMQRTRSVNAMIAVWVALLAALGSIALCVVSAGAAPADDREIQVPAITQAVFADGRLWMLREDGKLVSMKPDDRKAHLVELGAKTMAICKAGDDLLAVTEIDNERWMIRRQVRTNWNADAAVAVDHETVAAMACSSSMIVILTNRRLIQVNEANVRSVTLTEPLAPPFAIGTALLEGDIVWVGLNAGEWGGGLKRIGVRDGKVDTVEHNRSGDLCGGPLNSSCDPVNGIVPASASSGCVIAAVGLVHLMSHGRIVEVCENEVRRVYFKPVDPQPPYGKADDGEPSSTIAFSGLVRSGSTIWALGTDGLYAFEGSAPPKFRALPKFEDRGGYGVSFDLPGIALVLTSVDQRMSLSGTIPKIAAR